MEKLDFKKAYKNYYSAKQIPELAEFPTIPYLTISGQGEPGGSAFRQATECLFAMAYGIKRICKLRGTDFGVPPLEGLWWGTAGNPANETPRHEWHWKLLIRMPDFVTHTMSETVRHEVRVKKRDPLVEQVLLESLTEGKCAQVLHIGAYTEEQPTIAKLHAFMQENGLTPQGMHHEIYLGNPYKTPANELKTILRQPADSFFKP